MPAALNVDREAARVLCVALGVREAARKMGIPEATMQSWSARGNWATSYEKAKAAQAEKLELALNACNRPATKPADALAIQLADDSKQTRLGLSKAAKNAAKAFAIKPGEGVIKQSRALKDITAAASTLHGWEERKDAGLSLNIGLVFGGMG